ncbi:MAG: AEC family transporter [Megasphaera massiliensis]|uniref:AEC family transporter n=1 Tax=Megasphaera massiliensis TaxID=1232428 RepID=UPI002108DADB|nr:AEC family transporter [Megasphaera massiliensis]MCQ5210462.1 AEC family transporter [Megasphaera massiliensis]MEE0659362.1 AEC family transporter [Megasphaera massiliensis]
MLHGLEGIFEVLFIIAIGVILSKKGWFGSNMSAVFSKLVMKISLPLYMLCQMEKDFTHDSLIRIAPDLILPFASIFLAYIVGRIAAKVLHIRRERQGVFVTCFFIANTIFIGLPVNLALFGTQSVPSVMLYYMANTTMFWTLGIYHIVNDSQGGKGNMPLFSAQTIKKVFSPPLMGFLIGLALVLANIKLPDFLLTSFQYVGNMATPLSLLVIGIEMAGISFSDIHWDRDVVGALIGRFLVCPACVLALLPFIPVTPMSGQVFTMQASMPAMTQMTVVAKSIGADVRYSTQVTFITVVMGIVVIPLYMFIVG